jgi:hypothetical protein
MILRIVVSRCFAKAGHFRPSEGKNASGLFQPCLGTAMPSAGCAPLLSAPVRVEASVDARANVPHTDYEN